jgi:hypothetical protein
MNEPTQDPEKLLWLFIIVLSLFIILVLVWTDKKDHRITALERELDKIKRYLKI